LQLEPDQGMRQPLLQLKPYQGLKLQQRLQPKLDQGTRQPSLQLGPDQERWQTSLQLEPKEKGTRQQQQKELQKSEPEMLQPWLQSNPRQPQMPPKEGKM